MDVAFYYAVADAYEAMPHDPQGADARHAFAAFKDETRSRFEQVRSDVAIRPWVTEGQPYRTFADLAAGVAYTKTLYVFLTKHGYGTAAIREHPLLEDAGIAIDGERFTYNDLSRAIHDHDGHLASGGDFSIEGEMTAARTQIAHYSDAAARVLFGEIVGQICTFYYGSHLRRDGRVPRRGEPGYVPLRDRPYSDQKAALLPTELVDEWRRRQAA